MQERRSVGEPVRRRDEHAGAERRVDLVPREGEEVGLELVEVDPAVRCELRGIDEDERAPRVSETGDLGDRRHLAGDVRGAGDRDEGERIAGPLGLLERIRRCGEEGRRRRRERKMRDAMLAPGEQVRVVLERRAQHPRPGGRATASRFAASVVLRTKTTSSALSQPTKRATETRDSSNRVVE